MSIAAIVDSKRNQRLHAFDIRAIDDRSPLPETAKQPGADKNSKMRGKGIVRRADGLHNYARGYADGFVFDQKAENRKARWLRQGSQGRDCMRLRQRLA